MFLTNKMKFRAKLTDTFTIRAFYNLLNSMYKIAGKNSCILRITESKMFMMSNDQHAWAEVELEKLFSDCQFVGVTPTEPEIYLEFFPMQVVQTLAILRTPSNSLTVKVKLTRKRGQPCLTFQLDTESRQQVTHDIPVSPLPRKEWDQHGEPTYDRSSANDIFTVAFPDCKKLKYVVDRYKNLGLYVIMEGDKDDHGHLHLRLESDRVELSTTFKELEVVQNNRAVIVNETPLSTENNENESSNTVPVCVELRKLALYLGADQIVPRRVEFTLVRDHILHLALSNDICTMQYYIPAVLD